MKSRRGPGARAATCLVRPASVPSRRNVTQLALSDTAILRNNSRRPLPAGTPRARDRYRAAGLCVQCGRRRDRPDRLTCRQCRRRLADATRRYRRRPGDRTETERRAHRRYQAERRARWIAAGRCPVDGAERDRDDRKLCARCRRRAADLELPQFRGHLSSWRGGGVHDAEVETAVPGGIPTADGRAGSVRTYTGRAGSGVRAVGRGDTKLGRAG